MAKPDMSARMRLGLVIFVVLMVVEVVEYLIGVGLESGALALLALLAVPGAGLIVYYYMHISQLWRSEE
jgi:cytochrome c oxidase subunit IV